MEMHKNIRDFRNLNVWRKSIALLPDIYIIISTFPKYEEYALKSQLLRATQSISGNIAEGNGQMYVKKEINFLNTAIGSASECRNWLVIAYNNKYITKETFDKLDAEYESIIKMLYVMVRNILNS